MSLVATLAQETPVALETKGTVREARGLTSRTKSISSFTAYCTFISPTTPSSRARARVAFFISSTMASSSE